MAARGQHGDPEVRVAVLAIIDDELNQGAPELADDLEHRIERVVPIARRTTRATRRG